MRPDSLAYQDLISSLADGRPVDWAGLEAGAHSDHERRRYRNLRLVARIAELHKTLTLDDEAIEPVPGDDVTGPLANWGRLEVGERLASGGYGDLYRAHDNDLDRDVALKLLHAGPESLTLRLLSEARALARVSHPNVVIVHGADVADGRAGLWMELIDGQTLAAIVGERGRFGAAETVSIGRDLCRALAAVHAAGIIHSDVKAQNVMREAGGRIVLMDFGAGRRQGVETPVAGTPRYFAPEVLAGAQPTPASDLYSLGVLLFHLLTGRYPYEAVDLGQLRRDHADGRRTYLRDVRPDLPDALVDVVERAIDPDPASRYPSAGAMERALTKTQAPPLSWWKPAAIAGALAAAVGAAVFWPWPPSDTVIRSIAVLPFTSSGDDRAYLIDGLLRDVIRELQNYDVQVRTGTSRAAGFELDRHLGADAIVSGGAARRDLTTDLEVSVRRAGVAPFWTRTYPIPDAHLSAMAATIAQDIARGIGAVARAGARPTYQANNRAYLSYLRGRFLAEQRTPADLQLSLDAYQDAIKIDPNYAEAWAGMADTYSALGTPPWGPLRPMEARVRAREAAEKALSINPNLAEAETSIAWELTSFSWDWPQAEARFKRAIRLNPQYALAHHWFSMLLSDLGRFDEARAELRLAQQFEPQSTIIHRDFGWIDFSEGKFDQAIDQLQQTLARAPNYTGAVTLLARSLAASGRAAQGLIELDRVKSVLAPTAYLSFRGYIEAAGGDARARQTLAELRALASNGEYVAPYYFALIHTALGDRDQAIGYLQRGQSEQDSTMTSINVDPRFAPLRSDARFQRIIEEMRFPAVKR